VALELAHELEHVSEERHGETVDLRVDRDLDARRPKVPYRRDRGAVAPFDAPQPVVGALVSVDRDAHALEAGLRSRFATLRCEPAPAGRHERHHPALSDPSDDVDPIVAEVRLAPDDRHLTHLQRRHLIDEVEALLGAQLVGPVAAGARAAVSAREVARERDLPHGVERPHALVDRPHVGVERQPPQGWLRARRDRQRLGPRFAQLIFSRLGRERIRTVDDAAHGWRVPRAGGHPRTRPSREGARGRAHREIRG
jgi:hypothetical protein